MQDDFQFNGVSKRCGSGRQREIFHAVRSAVDTVKVRRGLNEVDVDEMLALYIHSGAPRDPKHASLRCANPQGEEYAVDDDLTCGCN
ncbi:ankyrin repeats (3 copies) family protein [Penicillium soppii]|uniref:ankyrin repeats (3 copies) family protein n=1 Tax=Penicillium soppii TaxID=69789 RepID=UPI002546E5D3|nr:ankyrin repeats (3 copies) family protein [Penicillium soppii]KAJ5863720.1 ankyrin repeats (3 copies) family protein [Penicillium soppii]